MKIKFLQDYVGRETAMQPYKAGDIVILQFPMAIELIRLGVAAGYEEPKRSKKKIEEVDDGEDA